jgi:hypothetical protein
MGAAYTTMNEKPSSVVRRLPSFSEETTCVRVHNHG